MACLNVANFGPIKRIASTRKGLEERKVTMLIGPQGSGKSTLLKLLCACHWLEKAYAKGLLAQNAFQTADLLKHQFDYYRMASYEQEDTVIDFQGEVLHLSYRHGKLDVDFKQGGQPPAKLLYVPSERSLVSLMKDYKAMRKLPESLLDFMGDYDSAKKYMVGDLNLGLPATLARYDAGGDQRPAVRDPQMVQDEVGEVIRQGGDQSRAGEFDVGDDGSFHARGSGNGPGEG